MPAAAAKPWANLDKDPSVAPTSRASPPFREAVRVTALVWLGPLVFLMGASAWSGQWQSLGDTFRIPVSYATAVGPALVIYLVFRGTASWPAWSAALALGLAAVLVGVVQNGLDDLLHIFVVKPLFPDTNPNDGGPSATARILFVYTALNAFNAAVFWAMAAIEHARDQGRLAAEQGRLAAEAHAATAEARAAADSAELRALRLQLNPHFMFNALNAVAGLIATNRPEQAQAMVHKLSQFLRGVLGGVEAKVSLADELGAVDDYLEVERVRFPNRIHLDVACPPDLFEARVPDFLLQPLIENSVKYGRASGGSVRVRVTAHRDGDQLQLTIDDNGHARTDHSPGFGLGQSTTEKRLACFYGESASLEATRLDAGYRVILRLPLEGLDREAGDASASAGNSYQ